MSETLDLTAEFVRKYHALIQERDGLLGEIERLRREPATVVAPVPVLAPPTPPPAPPTDLLEHIAALTAEVEQLRLQDADRSREAEALRRKCAELAKTLSNQT